jgi:hypothetical protein
MTKGALMRTPAGVKRKEDRPCLALTLHTLLPPSPLTLLVVPDHVACAKLAFPFSVPDSKWLVISSLSLQHTLFTPIARTAGHHQPSIGQAQTQPSSCASAQLNTQAEFVSLPNGRTTRQPGGEGAGGCPPAPPEQPTTTPGATRAPAATYAARADLQPCYRHRRRGRRRGNCGEGQAVH